LGQQLYRAVHDERISKFADGTIGPVELRVRFGEVEQRVIALAPKGRELYDQMLAETDRRLNETGGIRTDVARQVWAENLPDTEHGLAREDLAFFTYRVAEDASSETLAQLPEHVTLV